MINFRILSWLVVIIVICILTWTAAIFATFPVCIVVRIKLIRTIVSVVFVILHKFPFR